MPREKLIVKPLHLYILLVRFYTVIKNINFRFFLNQSLRLSFYHFFELLNLFVFKFINFS